jgi:hypothetical protein
VLTQKADDDCLLLGLGGISRMSPMALPTGAFGDDLSESKLLKIVNKFTKKVIAQHRNHQPDLQKHPIYEDASNKTAHSI